MTCDNRWVHFWIWIMVIVWGHATKELLSFGTAYCSEPGMCMYSQKVNQSLQWFSTCFQFPSFVFTLSLRLSLGLSSALWDLSGWADQQCQPPSSQPVSHHHNSCHFGHPLLNCGRPCVHLPAGLAQPGLQHCGWSHFHLHTGYQLHAVCASGNENTSRCMKVLTKRMKNIFIYFLAKVSVSFGLGFS